MVKETKKKVKQAFYVAIALLAHWHAGLLYFLGRSRRPGKKPCRCQRFQEWLEDMVMRSDSQAAQRILFKSWEKWP